MIEVIDGNLVIMIVMKDILLLDRLEGFVLLGQFFFLNIFVDVILKILVEIVEVKIQGEDVLFGKVYLELIGKVVVGYDEIVFFLEKLEMFVGVDDLRVFFGDVYQDLQVNRDSFVEKLVLDFLKENVIKELFVIGIFVVSSIILGIYVVNMFIVEFYVVEKCNVEIYLMEIFNLEIYGGEIFIVEQFVKEVVLKMDLKEEVVFLFGSIFV